MKIDPKTIELCANDRDVLVESVHTHIELTKQLIVKEEARLARRYSETSKTIISSLQTRLARAEDLLERLSD